MHTSLFLVIILALTEAAPVTNKPCLTNICPPTKKDLFVSRGWGASGMPFSVLYMKSPYARKSGPVAMASTQDRPRSFSQDSKSTVAKNRNRARKVEDGSKAVPQLFVSYGWGPMGRK